jgi:hypothetical protein
LALFAGEKKKEREREREAKRLVLSAQPQIILDAPLQSKHLAAAEAKSGYLWQVVNKVKCFSSLSRQKVTTLVG